MNKKLELLDCTLRDGGYLNDWNFDRRLARDLYAALSKAGVDFVELGYIGATKPATRRKHGIWRAVGEDDIRETLKNIKGAGIGLMMDYSKTTSDDIAVAQNCSADIIRVAANKDEISGALRLCENIKKKGHLVSLNAMGYTNYSPSERRDFVRKVTRSAIDYVYVADSYGSLFPDEIPGIFGPLLESRKDGLKIGFHSHNNIQMAFANTLAAISCGIDIIDATVYGMGRAAGNLPTEIIVSYLEHKNKEKYNATPVLNLIDMYFISLQKENPWGYQLPYMLSGMLKCHPNYAKHFVDSREYTIEDIWKALEYIRKSRPGGFSKELVGRVEKSGLVRGTDSLSASSAKVSRSSSRGKARKSKVSYLNRHAGRDFLILANGPSLKKHGKQIAAFIKKYKPVVMAGNYIGGLFEPDYHAFNNKKRFAAYIDSVSPESALLVGRQIPGSFAREYTKRDYEEIRHVDALNPFDVKNGVIQSNCRTIAVLLMGVAIVMGAGRIFCAGMDGYTITDEKGDFHFYNEKEETEDKEMILERHLWNLKFLEQIDSYLAKHQKEGIHILTPTGYKKFYKGIENYI